MDDLMNVSGHLLSTAEIESALASHAKVSGKGKEVGERCSVQVAEAAVVAAPHDIKGSFPYAFVTLIEVRVANKMIHAERDILRASV